MRINYKNENRRYENNVIYQITIGEYVYIGLTSRPLEMRIKEHIYSKSSPVNKYIKENNITEINVKIITKLPSNKRLDKKESQAIARYIVYNSKKKSFKNLLNIDFKGLDNMSIKELKELIRNY